MNRMTPTLRTAIEELVTNVACNPSLPSDSAWRSIYDRHAKVLAQIDQSKLDYEDRKLITRFYDLTETTSSPTA